MEEQFRWDKADDGRKIYFSDPIVQKEMIKIVNENDLYDDEIFATVFLLNGLGNFMCLEGPPQAIKAIDGKLLKLRYTIEIKRSKDGKMIPMYFYYEEKL